MTNMEPLDALFDDGPPAEAPIAPQPPDGALRDLAARLPRTMRLGTSTWNFPGWRGIIWSRGSGLTGLAENGLTAYSKNPLLRTVGLDRNFYRALTTAHFAHYAAQVPEDFRFIVKAPREVTDPYERDDRGRPTGTNPLFSMRMPQSINSLAQQDSDLGARPDRSSFNFPRCRIRNCGRWKLESNFSSVLRLFSPNCARLATDCFWPLNFAITSFLRRA